MTGCAKQSRAAYDVLDCFVASLLAMTGANVDAILNEVECGNGVAYAVASGQCA
jgi:allophanate hydrolase subunit 2